MNKRTKNETKEPHQQETNTFSEYLDMLPIALDKLGDGASESELNNYIRNNKDSLLSIVRSNNTEIERLELPFKLAYQAQCDKLGITYNDKLYITYKLACSKRRYLWHKKQLDSFELAYQSHCIKLKEVHKGEFDVLQLEYKLDRAKIQNEWIRKQLNK